MGLTSIKSLIDVCDTISVDQYLEGNERITPGTIQSLQQRFGREYGQQIDQQVERVRPDPSRVKELLDEFSRFNRVDANEYQFASSRLAALLIPSTAVSTITDAEPAIRLVVDHQVQLYNRQESQKRVCAVLLPEARTTFPISLRRVADVAWTLSEAALPAQSRQIVARNRSMNAFPTHATNRESLAPFMTAEVKVGGSLHEQAHQLAVYATFHILEWLTLKALQATKSRRLSSKTWFEGVCHFGVGISPFVLSIWEFRPTESALDGSVRISARILCSGYPGSESYLVEEYIPTFARCVRRGLMAQLLHFIPSLITYRARTQCPYEDRGSLILRARDFNTLHLDRDSLSFSTEESSERTQLTNELLVQLGKTVGSS